VEGGGRVHRTLFDAGFVDELHLFIAPMVLAQGAGWLGGPGIPLAEAPQLRIKSVTTVGPDLYLVLCRDLVTESVPGVRSER
jgi:diaminohydroxyphosphoribosylaminopyrimidine deaminase/5-amino-6-(5-phosphoribosylamino)uracil reductase